MRAGSRPLAAGIGAVLCTLALAAGAAPAADTADDPVLEARVQALSAELRCLVCQNQSLADSHAELAVDLKNQVRDQLRAGRSEAEVVAWMTDRYGDFVRYRPPWKTSTLMLWFGPALLVLAGAAVLWRALARREQVAEPAVDATDLARARRLLDET